MSQLENRPGSKGNTSAASDAPPGPPGAGAQIAFAFEGRRLTAAHGDTIAAALFRNGIRTLSWSVKYHRPRSIFCGRGRCSTCQVEVDGRPGVKSCSTPVRTGMQIRRQDFRPFYGGALTAVARLIPLPAGFYYRAFTRPALVRRLFLGTLRRMAGVARVQPHAVTASPAKQPRPLPGRRYDVVVAGAGVSGMQAALAAARMGRSVLLVDEYAQPGGHSAGHVADADLARRRDELADALPGSGIETRFGASAQGFYPPDTMIVDAPRSGDVVETAVEEIRAGAFVFATGAYDTIPLFENNDTPGVFGPRGIRLFLERDGIVPGRRAVVYGTAELVPGVAALLRAHGIEVAGAAFVAGGVPVDGCSRTVENATLRRASGGEWVRSADFDTPGGGQRIACDLLCVALPGQPSFELAHQAGFRYAFPDVAPAAPDAERVMIPASDRLDTAACRCFVAGEAAGIADWKERIAGAAAIGAAAAEVL